MISDQIPTLFAASGVFKIFDGVTIFLAVVGGAIFGGLLIGYLSKLLAPIFIGKELGPRMHRVMQILGAIGIGYLAYFLVSARGGSGDGDGNGKGGGKGGTGGTHPTVKEGKPPIKDNDKPPKTTAPIEVEVLGNLPLGSEKIYYLRPGNKLLDLDDVKQELKKLHKENSERKIQLILYRDSPARDKKQVSRLEVWLSEILMKAPEVIERLGDNAPNRK